MGLMRLAVHDRDRIPPAGLGQVYMCGADELPWFGRAYMSGNQLVIERAENDSGSVYVPWRIDGHGVLLVATSTLMERERPYLLEVELARGTINRLRNQVAQWEALGLIISDGMRKQILAMTHDFAQAATTDDAATAAESAGRALTAALDAMGQLASVYAEQAIGMRRAQTPKLATWFGVQLGGEMPAMGVARQLLNSFNMVSVPLTWRAIEASEGRRNWKAADAQLSWAQTAGMKVMGGPLLELDDRGVPDWTYLWEGDFDSLLAFMLDHVTTVVKKYRGKVHLWQVAARMSHGRVLALNEEQRLQIAARAISKVKELDPSTPLIATFDQPWAEYLATEKLDLAPLHFADALVRGDLGLSGLGLEINVGYHPGATAHRTPLAFSRLIDTWSLLELPLVISLTLPSSAEKDDLANAKTQVLTSEGSDVSGATQRAWIERYMPMLLAKTPAQVILWNQLSDAAPHYFPHGGLFDASDQPKPALEALRRIRQQYLM
jgi:Glycosyl hydrolase family 10